MRTAIVCSSHTFICLSLVSLVFYPSIAAAVATTSLFDVQSSLQRTHDVQSSHQQSFYSSPSYSVRLLPRLAVFGTPYTDYRSLTLARLKRDSDRVKWLQTRLDLTADWTIEEAAPVAPSSDSQEYFVELGIGDGGGKFLLALDTGSDLTWVKCSECSNCVGQIFDPATSSTFSKLPCGADQCNWLGKNECPSGTCQYQREYGDGSQSAGDLSMESISFGGGSDLLKNITIGCSHNVPNSLLGQAAGIMGLGRGQLSIPSQLKASSFSYCLVHHDSNNTSTLDFGLGLVDYLPQTIVAPMKMSDHFYPIGLNGISVGGGNVIRIQDDQNGVILMDSGTVVSRLPDNVYNSVKSEFVDKLNQTQAPAFDIFDTCFHLLNGLGDVRVPTVSFHFSNGNKLQLPAKNCLVPVDSSGTYCFAFGPAGSSNPIIGNVQQQGIRVTYDLPRSLFGFTPGYC